MSVMNFYNKDKRGYEKIPMVGLGKQVISDAFSPVRSYSAGDYCIKDNTLFKFTSPKASGEWDPSAVQATNVGVEIGEIRSNSLDVFDYISGNTDAGGNADTSNSNSRKPIYANECKIVSAYCTEGYVVLPWAIPTSSGNRWIFKVFDVANATPVINKNITVYYYYQKLNT